MTTHAEAALKNRGFRVINMASLNFEQKSKVEKLASGRGDPGLAAEVCLDHRRQFFHRAG